MVSQNVSLIEQSTAPQKKQVKRGTGGLKRYNLVLPEELFDELQGMADRENTTVVDVLRKFIKIGLLVDKVSNSDNSKLLIRENNVDREVILV